jgi:hypothetical protein
MNITHPPIADNASEQTPARMVAGALAHLATHMETGCPRAAWLAAMLLDKLAADSEADEPSAQSTPGNWSRSSNATRRRSCAAAGGAASPRHRRAGTAVPDAGTHRRDSGACTPLRDPALDRRGLAWVLALHGAAFWGLLQMNVISLPAPLAVLSVSLLQPAETTRPIRPSCRRSRGR